MNPIPILSTKILVPDGFPPDQKSYIHPKDKREEYYINFHSTKEVVDAALIQRLENEDAPEEDASIDRPLSSEEIKHLKDNDIL